MKQVRSMMVLAFLLLCANARAQMDVERMLVPVFVDQAQPGAFGSAWSTDLWIFNRGPEPATIATVPGLPCRAAICVGAITLNPDSARRYSLPGVDAEGLRGLLLYAWREDANQLELSLRVRDESRGSRSPGTEVPVVRAAGLHRERFHLLNIPIDADLRVSLRVYGLDDVPDREPSLVRIRAFFMDGGTIAYEALLTIHPSPYLWEETFPGIPDFGLIENLQDLIEQGRGPVRIEIEPWTTETSFWTMVTATDNVSQHVTVIGPTDPCSFGLQ